MPLPAVERNENRSLSICVGGFANHDTRTYGRLLGPCFKTGEYGPLTWQNLAGARAWTTGSLLQDPISPLPGTRPKNARVSPMRPGYREGGRVAPAPSLFDARRAGVTHQRRCLPARRKSKESPVHTPHLNSPGRWLPWLPNEPRGVQIGRPQGAWGGWEEARQSAIPSALTWVPTGPSPAKGREFCNQRGEN